MHSDQVPTSSLELCERPSTPEADVPKEVLLCTGPPEAVHMFAVDIPVCAVHLHRLWSELCPSRIGALQITQAHAGVCCVDPDLAAWQDLLYVCRREVRCPAWRLSKRRAPSRYQQPSPSAGMSEQLQRLMVQR